MEALENRELLSVAPTLPSVWAEFATEPVCVAEETPPTVDLAELNAEFERNAELNATSQNDATSPLFADAESGNYALAAGSQAINAGDDALAVDAAGNPLTFDLAGKARFGGVVDLGPYEYYYTAPSLATPTLGLTTRDASTLALTVGYVSNASSYLVEYSTDPTYATSTTRTFASSGVKKLNGVAANSTFYVRVRADGIGGCGDSFWSAPASGSTAPTSSALLTDEAFATPFDDFGFFAEEENDERWAF